MVKAASERSKQNDLVDAMLYGVLDRLFGVGSILAGRTDETYRRESRTGGIGKGIEIAQNRIGQETERIGMVSRSIGCDEKHAIRQFQQQLPFGWRLTIEKDDRFRSRPPLIALPIV